MPNAIDGLRQYDLELPPMHHHGRIANAGTRAANQMNPKSDDELFALYQKNHALVEDVPRGEMFFWSGEISNSSLDSWFTRMATSSLQNYAADAINPSVSFQDSHARNELGVGRSLWSEYVTTGNPPDGVKAEDYFPVVYADFFTSRGMQLGKMTTDNFIKGVQRGVIRDLSIGFKEGEGFQYTCSVCGLDLWDWDCMHIPGCNYDIVDNPDADPSQQRSHEELCFAWVENARLSEVSAVYDGATTNAMIVKAQREARAGRLQRNNREFLEHRYRFQLDTGRKLWTGADILRDTVRTIFTDPADAPLVDQRNARLSEVGIQSGDNSEKEQRQMPGQGNTNSQPGGAAETPALDYTPQYRQACVNVGLTIDEKASATDCVNALVEEVRRLQPLSEELKTVRAAEVEDAVKEKVRAFGDKANEEKTRKMLGGADVETIRQFRQEWREIGDKRFAGGRRSDEAGEGEEGTATGEQGGADSGAPDKAAAANAAPTRYIPTSGFGAI
jgi:hypothetical protein